MNNLTIAGNVGNVRGPSDAAGKRVLNFSIAVNDGRDRDPIWFDCALWGDRADKLAPYIDKGSKLTVVGKVSADVYDGKPKLKVFVLDLTLQGGRGEQPAAPQQRPEPVTSPQQDSADDFESDSIPF